MTQEGSQELVVVTSLTNPNLAQVLRLTLDAEGIPCEVEGGGQAGLTGVLPIRLFVRAEDLERAREVLNIHVNRSMIERIKPMRIEIEKICVPTDFSQNADHALAYGLNLARQYKSEVHVLHVVEKGEDLTQAKSLADTMSPVFVTDFLETLESDSDASQLEQGFVNVKFVRTFRAGSPVQEICRYVEEQGIDLVVIGTRGRTGLERVVLGSVAENLVRKCVCPVLSVRLQPNTESADD